MSVLKKGKTEMHGHFSSLLQAVLIWATLKRSFKKDLLIVSLPLIIFLLTYFGLYYKISQIDRDRLTDPSSLPLYRLGLSR